MIIAISNVSAFIVKTPSTNTNQQLKMGMFDFVGNAFKNADYDDRRVTASHILLESEEEAVVVLKSIQTKELTFGQAAKEYSSCPSYNQGGSLGTFEPGKMVPEFDLLVFDESASPIGQVVGPLKTPFGYHLIVVQERLMNQERSEGSGVF